MPGMLQFHFLGEFPSDSVYLLVREVNLVTGVMTLECLVNDCGTRFVWPIDRKAKYIFAPSLPMGNCLGCGKKIAGVYKGYDSEEEYRSLHRRQAS